MRRKRGKDEWFPLGDVFSGQVGSEQTLQEASPQAAYHFTRLDQVDQLVEASEDDPDMGFMARLMTLCSLPRTNPGNRLQYIRRNGPYTLGMAAGIRNKLPYGNIPRLLLAWVCTEAVKTQSRELVLGRSLSEFMRELGMQTSGGSTRGDRARLRNQMDRLFNAQVSLIYEDDRGKATVNSQIADRTELWWNPKRPGTHRGRAQGRAGSRTQGRQEVRAVESPGAAGSGRDGPPRHVGVRTVPPTRHQAGDALQVRRTAGPVA